jgi:signal transduction histidine kinase
MHKLKKNEKVRTSPLPKPVGDWEPHAPEDVYEDFRQVIRYRLESSKRKAQEEGRTDTDIVIAILNESICLVSEILDCEKPDEALKIIEGHGRRFVQLIQDSDEINKFLGIQNGRSLCLEELLSKVNHEILTPISCINLALESLADKKPTHDQNKSLIDIIYKSSDKIAKIYSELKMCSSLLRGELEPNMEVFKVSELLHEVIDISFSGNSHLISAVHSDSLVYTDRSLLKSILESIIDNAFKFSHSQPIMITAKAPENDLYLKISIIDKGVGFPTELTDRLFKCFEQYENGFTRKFGGLGIGLSKITLLCRLLNIGFDITNNDKNGSTVHVILKSSSYNDNPASLDENELLKTKDVVILYINNTEQSKIQYLETLGYTVFNFSNKRFYRNPLDTRQFDVVIINTNSCSSRYDEELSYLMQCTPDALIFITNDDDPIPKLEQFNYNHLIRPVVTESKSFSEIANNLCVYIRQHFLVINGVCDHEKK